MKVLITSYTTPQASHRFCFFHKIVGDFTYFVASDVCENFPYDFNVAALKNKCIKAARITQPDWLVLLSGIDAGLSKLPNFKKLDENILYLGKKICRAKVPEKASNWILSKKIYNNYLIDESYKCYGWEDYDFTFNTCKDLKKETLDDFLTVDILPDLDHLKLVNRDEYAIKTCQQNEKLFFDKYKALHGFDFVFPD